MENNTPITDAELAELRRLHAAAGIEYLKHVPGTLKDYVCGPDGDTFGFSTQRLHWNDGRDTNSENICPAIVATFNAFPGILALIEDLQAYRDEVEAAKPTVQALLDSGERAASEVADLRQRLEDAERELAEVKMAAGSVKSQAYDAECGLWLDILRRLDPENLCDVFDGLGIEGHLHAWLAARDAQQRREGATEAFDEMRRQAEEVGKQSGLAEKMCKIFADERIEQAAKRLRERGE